MGLATTLRNRLAELSREAGEIFGGCLHSDDQPMTFAELENECIEAGDLFTAAVPRTSPPATQMPTLFSRRSLLDEAHRSSKGVDDAPIS